MTTDNDLQLAQQMRDDWNMRASRDALHWTVNVYPEGQWNLAEYLDTGETTIAQSLDPFLQEQGKDPATLKAFEIGCGAGRLTCGLAKRFKKVFGLDVSTVMVDKATQMVADQGYSNVTLWPGDGVTLQPQKDNSIDVVYSCIVFQHIPNVDLQLGYLEEVARILKPGGLFVISLYNDLRDYQEKLGWWQAMQKSRKTDNELVRISLDNFSTTMQTYIPAEAVDKTLAESGLELVSETGRGTWTWWLYGRKL